MPKTNKAGASAAVPASVIRNVLEMRAAGDSLTAIQVQLNRWAIPYTPPGGVPSVGAWTTTAVQHLITANTEEA
ncbi:hypothetical protein [Streptomyces sp. NPDC020681]|uniref:hypothetical protein n=1 Tax=Streptomyces sp. NPDC020681 TaxID=3365083 RepID=UPI003790BBDC